MRYKHPGFPRITKKMCAKGNAIMLGLEKIKIKRTGNVGMKYDRAEDRDRAEITKRLRKDGWRVTYVEPHGRYKKDEGFNLGDTWLENDKMTLSGWGEYKSNIGKLKPGQKKFKDRCHRHNVKYWVIRLCEDGYKMTSD